MVDAIESRLGENQWLGGQQPSKEDAEQFAAMGGNAPNVDTHPNAFSWYALVSRFTEAVTGTWAAGSAPAAAGGKKAGKGGKAAAPKKEAPKAAAAAAAEEEFDPFAEDPEADAAAAEAMKKKEADAKAAKPKKAPPAAKSLIVWEVKPWGEETDLEALADKILAINMDGLAWKTQWKKEPVAYGVFKIQIGATIEDAKVSTDVVQETIEALRMMFSL